MPAHVNGPAVKVLASCFVCKHCTAEPFAGRDGLSHHVYCTHPSSQVMGSAERFVGDRWSTPRWCPLLMEAVEAFVAKMQKEV